MRLYGFLLTLVLGLLLPVQAVTFVQMADPQFGMGDKGYQADIATFNAAIAQINTVKPDFTVICGDLAHQWTPEAAQDMEASTQGFASPYYAAMGNHDLDAHKFTQLFQEDRRVVEQGNVTLLIINTNLWSPDMKDAGDVQLAWLEQALKTAAEKKQIIVVAGHHPLFVQAADEEDQYFNTPKPRRAQLLALFEQYKVSAFLTGHLHYSVSGYYHGILLQTAATTSKNFSGEPFGFRVWRIDPKGYITQEFVPVKMTEQP